MTDTEAKGCRCEWLEEQCHEPFTKNTMTGRTVSYIFLVVIRRNNLDEGLAPVLTPSIPLIVVIAFVATVPFVAAVSFVGTVGFVRTISLLAFERTVIKLPFHTSILIDVGQRDVFLFRRRRESSTAHFFYV